ncbi:MAG: tripartite tricarboxylate transporter substrate binding protein [Methylobacterium sp.]|nr:tripartite tricarboxylate transporter substrate binding protein [Methylobacterium sp.]
MVSRREFGRLAAAAIGAVALPAISRAAPMAYPYKVVTLITHSSPGGGSDVFLREMSKHLGRYIDATFVVENVQGGSGARAISRLATARPDGSVFYATTPTYIFTSLLSKPQHSFRDVQPLVNVFSDAEVVYTRADGPFKTLADVIAHAKEKRGRWGAANPASLERQAAERLKAAAGVNAAIVSHEGGGDLMINVLNGTLDIGVGEIPELRAQLEAKKVRLLAVFNAQRLPTQPDIPTVKESGFDVVVQKFRGLAGPKGLPADVIGIWEKAIPQLLADAEYRRIYAAESLVPDFIPQAAYATFINDFAQSSEAFFRETGVIKN